LKCPESSSEPALWTQLTIDMTRRHSTTCLKE
jgi:hypothetical protein